MFSLYEIDESITRFIDVIYASMESDGTVAEEAMEELESLNEERQMKIENVALYIKELEANADAIEAEEKKLADRKKSIRNKADWLKRYLSGSMQMNNETSFETSRCKLTFRKSEAVEITNEDSIPEWYLLKDIVYKPNKAEIKKALKAGQEVAGCTLKVNHNLQIK